MEHTYFCRAPQYLAEGGNSNLVFYNKLSPYGFYYRCIGVSYVVFFSKCFFPLLFHFISALKYALKIYDGRNLHLDSTCTRFLCSLLEELCLGCTRNLATDIRLNMCCEHKLQDCHQNVDLLMFLYLRSEE